MHSRFLSARALRLHAATIVVVSACLGFGWWQLSRALGGNTLSWVYTFEWPFFALYAIYMWWKLLHEPLRETRAAEIEARSVPPRERELLATAEASEEEAIAERVDALGFDPYDESDPELAAYNRYLASLHAADATAGRRRRGGRS